MGAEMPMPVVILLELYFTGVVTDGDLKRVEFRCDPLPIESEGAK